VSPMQEDMLASPIAQVEIAHDHVGRVSVEGRDRLALRVNGSRGETAEGQELAKGSGLAPRSASSCIRESPSNDVPTIHRLVVNGAGIGCFDGYLCEPDALGRSGTAPDCSGTR
jgi:hypothetical protein